MSKFGPVAIREAIAILQDAGIAAERDSDGDISTPVLGVDRRLQVKCSSAGFSSIYRWLSGYFGLVLSVGQPEPLIIVRLADFAQLAIAADRKRTRDDHGPRG